jgi:hypothetical protein
MQRETLREPGKEGFLICQWGLLSLFWDTLGLFVLHRCFSTMHLNVNQKWILPMGLQGNIEHVSVQ